LQIKQAMDLGNVPMAWAVRAATLIEEGTKGSAFATSNDKERQIQMIELEHNFVMSGARRAGIERIIFSLVVDNDPRFTYQAWHLARSLVEHCGRDPTVVHVQCTPDVSGRTRSLFRECGYYVCQIARFGDGRKCDKLNQLETLHDIEFDYVVLLDTDMIAISDIRTFLSDQAILGAIVGFAKPSLATLREIAIAAGLPNLPPVLSLRRRRELSDGPGSLLSRRNARRGARAYHAQLNVRGWLEVPFLQSSRDQAAVTCANQQIGRGFDNRVFWDMRYRHGQLISKSNGFLPPDFATTPRLLSNWPGAPKWFDWVKDAYVAFVQLSLRPEHSASLAWLDRIGPSLKRRPSLSEAMLLWIVR
jgi:hypothetical protein